MNNILTFEEYRKMNIRQVESVIYHQFMKESFKDKETVNEGFIRNAINKASSKFIQSALSEEIEKGKELEKSIKEALDGLNEGISEIGKTISSGDKTSKDPETRTTKLEKIKEAIKNVQSQTFDTLTMIGSGGEIDFAGFLGSASVNAAANFGILFSPIRSVFITRKAYKYFLGIIKQTIRRNLLVIQLNFDQFENLILQKSFEAEDSDAITRRETIQEVFNKMEESLFGPTAKGDIITGKKNIDNLKKYIDTYSRYQKDYVKNNPFNSLWQDQHNNTYTRTLEQLKQHINDDSQKELDALKNSITKMAGNDPDLLPYGELLISAAEEYAINTCYGINNNFIKMSSVFNLENQKKLIELIKSEHDESLEEIKGKTKEGLEDVEDVIKDEREKGKKIYEELMESDVESYTIESFNKKYNADDLKALRAFLQSEEGKELYKKLLEKNIIFKYILLLNFELNKLLHSFNDLEVVEIDNSKDFYDEIVKEDQALYYMMADRSLKDAFVTDDEKKLYNSDYFGFDIPSERVNKNILESKSIEEIYNFDAINEGAAKLKQVERNKAAIEQLTNQLQDQQKVIDKLLQKEQETDEERKKLADDRKNLQELIDKYTKLLKDVEIDNKEKYKEVVDDAEEEIENTEEYVEFEDDSNDDSKNPKDIDDILTKELFPDDKTKKYFLRVGGDGKDIFNILHKEFKTEIFEGDKYVKEISTDSKLTIFKIIFDILKIGEDVAEQFSKHLVALEAHMLLNPKDSWFVVKDNTELIEKEQCFNKDSEKIVNNNAFVEISQDDYKKFDDLLKKFGKKQANDFNPDEDE